MKNLPVGSVLFQIDCHERHGHDKGCFSNFLYHAKEPTHTHTHTHTRASVILFY